MKVLLPTSADEAVGLLGEGTLMAGGTHLMPRLMPDESIVSLRHAGLSGVGEDGESVRLGATTTLAEVGRRVPFLRSAIESIASPTIRNLATVGGNLFVPQPHGDFAVCLLALDAQIEKTEGLVTSVTFKVPERWYYTKAMRRRQNSAAIVTVASDGSRIALGGVAPQPVRALKAEAALPDIDAAAEAALDAADPADDAFASAWYRRRVIPVHVRRALSTHAV